MARPAHVLVAMAPVDDGSRAWDRYVGAEERMRAARLVPAARAPFVAGRALLRLVVAAASGCRIDRVSIQTDPLGKPFVTGLPLHVSVSHAAGAVAVAATTAGPVGVDIAPRTAPVIERALSADERALLATLPADERRSAFARLWCVKESIVKATGRGIGAGFRGVAATLDEEGRCGRLVWRRLPDAADVHGAAAVLDATEVVVTVRPVVGRVIEEGADDVGRIALAG